MNFKTLTTEIWNTLDRKGSLVDGYKGIWLSTTSGAASKLHIFVDEIGRFHLAIECGQTDLAVEDPGVTGLSISVQRYRVADSVKKFIDLQCSSASNLREFTGIVKEIAGDILLGNENPIVVVNRILRNWKAFWSRQIVSRLNEDQVRGLIAELFVLDKICHISPILAISGWRGPFAEVHDFVFSDWTLEVKGTLSNTVIINGLDQLDHAASKDLALVSIQLSVNDSPMAITLPSLVSQIASTHFIDRPDLNQRFNELLFAAGYSPVEAESYSTYKVEILEQNFYIVDENFPKITPTIMVSPPDDRIGNVKYSLLLTGLPHQDFESIPLRQYCH